MVGLLPPESALQCGCLGEGDDKGGGSPKVTLPSSVLRSALWPAVGRVCKKQTHSPLGRLTCQKGLAGVQQSKAKQSEPLIYCLKALKALRAGYNVLMQAAPRAPLPPSTQQGSIQGSFGGIWAVGRRQVPPKKQRKGSCLAFDDPASPSGSCSRTSGRSEA